ncbi:TPA: polyprenyl synthetase family protein, partial [Campylobacter fetus]|nr:polyprenyl synthetase family protein [Campylobacter fetus]
SKFKEFDIINLSIKKAKDFGAKAIESSQNTELKMIVSSMIDRDF